MYKKEAVVKSTIGLHARPATMLVKLASKFKSKLIIEFEGERINAKSIWEVLEAGINGGAGMMVVGEGEDEIDAVEKIVALIETEEE